MFPKFRNAMLEWHLKDLQQMMKFNQKKIARYSERYAESLNFKYLERLNNVIGHQMECQKLISEVAQKIKEFKV